MAFPLGDHETLSQEVAGTVGKKGHAVKKIVATKLFVGEAFIRLKRSLVKPKANAMQGSTSSNREPYRTSAMVASNEPPRHLSKDASVIVEPSASWGRIVGEKEIVPCGEMPFSLVACPWLLVISCLHLPQGRS